MPKGLSVMIKIIKKLFKNETFLYLFFGGWTTIVNYGVFYLFYDVIGFKSTLANLFAFVAALVFSFITNKIFVFESKSFSAKTLWREIAQYSGSRILTFFMEEVGLWLCEDVFHMGDWEIANVLGVTIDGVVLAKLVLAVLVVLINYVFCKLFVFKRKENDE